MEGDPGFVPYSQRPEWSDVAPAEASPGDPGNVVAVKYSKHDKELLGYFNACVAKGEKGERVLQLTADVIAANQAHYSAWQYRWEVLQELATDLTAEYEFTQRIAADSAKNYQLWNHQRKLAKALGAHATQRELDFCTSALETDSKNYHAWAHRQVVVASGSAWQQELRYVQRLLAEDVRNNSAWNQRFFVLQHTLGQYSSLEHVMESELCYLAEQIARVPDNESAWNYLWGLFTLPGCRPAEMGAQHKVHIICREALSDSPSCKPALDTLAQYYYWLAQLAEQQQQHVKAAAAAGHSLKVLAAAEIADPMRSNYWRYRRQQVQQLLARLPAQAS
ncbi:hypothetical protein COO60DRAFT_704582 [Scenedesmus sp. NREL 46B-D3]|nr:hypothetical protein COO60DRAFT_704582 [Scenedesmus sp. NREL 46B-D3]